MNQGFLKWPSHIGNGSDRAHITPIKKPNALAKAISSLVNNDELRLQMGINAKKRMEKVYHINDTVEDTFKLYQHLFKH